jgi:hypothetical protein
VINVSGCGQIGRDFGRPGPSCSVMRPTRAKEPNGYLLGSYRIATAPGPNSSRLTSLKSIAAPVQCNVDGIPKGSHYARVPPMG